MLHLKIQYRSVLAHALMKELVYEFNNRHQKELLPLATQILYYFYVWVSTVTPPSFKR